MHPDTTLLETLLDQETRVWDALVAGDMDADASLLSDDFLGVYPDGFATKADHTGQLADGPSIAAFDIFDPRARVMEQDHAVLSYRAEFRRTGREETEVMYVTSIWRRTSSGWINILSQDTPAKSG